MKILAVISILSSLFVANISSANIRQNLSENSLPLLEGEQFDYANQFYDDFSNGISSSNWYISKRAWGEVNGRTNGGVIPENVKYDTNKGIARLYARGEYYAKEEFNGVGSVTDGSLTGGALVLKQTTAPGRYEIRMKVAPRVGICNAFWTYTEDENGNNHEIDIELPGKIDGYNSFNNVLFTNYIGNATSNQKVLDYYLSDDEYHTFGFDWYYSANHKLINYYIDGELLATSTTNVPFLETRLWVGVWIPNNVDFVGEPLFDSAYMDIDYVKYIPFKNQIYTPNDNLNPGIVALEDEYPSDSNLSNEYNKIPNGDFEYYKNNPTYENIGIDLSGDYEISEEYGNNSYGLKLNNGELEIVLDSSYDVNDYDLQLDYIGSGNLSIEYYSKNNALLDSKNYILNNNEKYDTFSQKLGNCPANSFYLKLILNTNSTIYIDNLFLGILNEIIDEPIVSDTYSSYGVGLLNNSTLTTDSSYNGIFKMDFDNSNREWVTSNGGISNSNFVLGCNPESDSTSELASTHLMDGSSIEETNFVKISNAIENYGFELDVYYIQAMYMNFDITDFKDITFYINSYNVGAPSDAPWYRNLILYSIDEGDTWSILNYNNLRDSNGTASTDLDTYQVDGSINNLTVNNFDKIRFAYAYLAYSMGGQGVCVSGISINRESDFMDKIDNDTNICNYAEYEKQFLNTQYNNLSEEEKVNLNTIHRKNSPNQTYIEGYNYLLDYWNKLNGRNSVNTLIKQPMVFVNILSLISAFIIVSLLIKNRKKFYDKDKKIRR